MAKHHGESEIKAALEAAQAAFREHQQLRLAACQRGETAAAARAAFGESMRRGLANRRQAQAQVRAIKHPPIFTPIPILTAYSVTEDPAGLPFSWHVGESDNVANAFFEHGIDTPADDTWESVSIQFWFYWQNQSEDVSAIINNVTADLAVYGTFLATANSHYVHNGETFISVDAVVAGHTSQGLFPGDTHYIGTYHTKGNHNNGPPTTKSGLLSDVYHLSLPHLVVDPGQGASIAVVFHVDYFIRQGQVNFDFDSSGYFIECPGVHMDLLSSMV